MSKFASPSELLVAWGHQMQFKVNSNPIWPADYWYDSLETFQNIYLNPCIFAQLKWFPRFLCFCILYSLSCPTCLWRYLLTFCCLGPACSSTLEPLAGISHHYRTVVISYSAEGSNFTDRSKYPYFFRTIGENNQYQWVQQLLRVRAWLGFTCRVVGVSWSSASDSCLDLQ